MDPMDEALADLKDELELARAEQAEALRCANHLRSIGEYPRLREALLEVDLQHSKVCRLQNQLRQRLRLPD